MPQVARSRAVAFDLDCVMLRDSAGVLSRGRAAEDGQEASALSPWTGRVMTPEEPGSRSAKATSPAMWVLRCCLYGLTVVYVLPVIMFGAMATLLLADGKWLGVFVCASACVVYSVLAWKRLHGKLSYIKPPPILELRRQLKQRPPR